MSYDEEGRNMRRWTKRAAVPVAAVAALAIVAACGDSIDDGGSEAGTSEDPVTEDDEAGSASEWPDTISYGVLPTSDEANLAATYEPFETYMAACLDHPFELFTGTNYTAMIEAMRGGNIHLSKFGAFSYIIAAERAGADALVQPLADPDDEFYTSMVIALESSGFDSLEDLEGQPFAWVDATSTSGHLFPRAMMLQELGLDNDEIEGWLGEVVESGGHDASIVSVLNGDVAAAPISSNAWVLQIEQEGDLSDHENFDQLYILAETEDIPRTVEAVAPDLPDDLRAALLECFTGAAADPSLADFLDEINAPAGYYPVDDSAYDVVRNTADALGMSPDDLLG
jgi:phosphonate transport system substrate-binding protein